MLAGRKVRAKTFQSDEYEEPAKDVEGTLLIRKIYTLQYAQCFVNGVQVDPSTIEPLEG